LLNAQDTALFTQQSKIDELESTLDNKIALDLADATSDANATASDIAEGKTAYVNGIRLVGSLEVLEKIVLPDGIHFQSSSVTNMDWLEDVDTSNLTDTSSMFYFCKQLVTIPTINTINSRSFATMFYGCSELVNLPLLDTRNVSLNQYSFRDAFGGCPKLSEQSLNNILQMCINATRYTGAKTLYYIGLTSAQATTCQSLSNYQDFLDAGWTTGY
jgi:hypothetical protein